MNPPKHCQFLSKSGLEFKLVYIKIITYILYHYFDLGSYFQQSWTPQYAQKIEFQGKHQNFYLCRCHLILTEILSITNILYMACHQYPYWLQVIGHHVSQLIGIPKYKFHFIMKHPYSSICFWSTEILTSIYLSIYLLREVCLRIIFTNFNYNNCHKMAMQLRKFFSKTRE